MKAVGGQRRQQANTGRDAAKKLEQRINKVAAEIQQFRVDSQRFLVGDLPLPPDGLKEKIHSEIRRLRNSNLKGAAVNFRLGSLEAQFNSYADLLSRRMRKRELSATSAVAEVKRQVKLDPQKGIVVGPRMDSAAAKVLYEGLKNPKMDLEKFHGYLNRQAEVIRSKTGCSEIQFRIANQDGKLKLKAKPIRD